MIKAKYNAIDIARFIVNYSNKIEAPISNLKLQKLLYFVQRSFIKIYGYPCFAEDIEAWAYGPVVPEVYQEFRQYGSHNIPTIEQYYYINYARNTVELRNFDNSFISFEDAEIIEYIVFKYKEISAIKLANITHSQKAWEKAYKSGYNKTISMKDLLD